MKQLQSSFQAYLHSFQQWKEVLFSFTIDSATALAIFLLLFLFGTIIKSKIGLILQGRSVEEVKQQLISGSLENAEQLTDNILSFAYTFFGGILLVLVLSLLIYSLSQSYLWSYLNHQKFYFRRHWKWNWLTLVLVIFLGIYSLLYVVARFILNFFLPATTTLWSSVLIQFFSFLFFLAFCFYGYSASYHFIRSHLVWKSIGEAFHSFSSNFFGLVLFALGTAIITGLVSFYLRQALLRFYWVEFLIPPVLMILFLSWFRVYFLSSLHEHPPAS